MNISIHNLITIHFRQASEYTEYETNNHETLSYLNDVTEKFVRNVNIISAGELPNQSANSMHYL